MDYTFPQGHLHISELHHQASTNLNQKQTDERRQIWAPAVE